MSNEKDPYDFLNTPKIQQDGYKPLPTHQPQPMADSSMNQDAMKKFLNSKFGNIQTPANLKDLETGYDVRTDKILTKEEVAPQIESKIREYSELQTDIKPRETVFVSNKPEIENTSNPLTQFFRLPEKYIRLPTMGYFDKYQMERTVNGEVAVYPMSNSDDIALKTPDGLLNGASLKKIIKSCVPAIKSVDDITIPDLNAIMLAIRSASYDNQMDIDVECPACKQISTYGIDIDTMLDTAEVLTSPYPDLIIEINKRQLAIKIRPYSFSSLMKLTILSFQEETLIKAVNSQESASDEKRIQVMASSIEKIAKLKNELLVESIDSINTGDQVVTDKKFILQFVENISNHNLENVEEELAKLNNFGVKNTVETECKHCKHKHETTIDPGLTNFFTKPLNKARRQK